MIKTVPAATNRVNSSALENGRQVKTGGGTLISVIGYNHGPEQFIQLFDSANAPANGAAPILTFKVASGGVMSIDTPIKFTAGMYVANSTIVATRTAGAANCWFLAQVL